MTIKRIIGLKRYLVLPGIAAALLLFASVHAQEEVIAHHSGRGVVRFAADFQSMTPQDLYPHTCATSMCAALQPLLYPRLFDVDPATGALLDASESDNALAIAIPTDLPADEIVIPLRQDRLWSDGESVTAYDVLFSLLAYTESAQNPYYPALGQIVGVHIIDEYTIALRYAASEEEIAELPPDASPLRATCDDLPRSNVYILPSHYLSPGFHEFVDQNPPEGESPSLIDWWKAYWDEGLNPPSNVPDEPVTSGAYQWVGSSSDQDLRFTPADSMGAALEQVAHLLPISERPSNVNAFIAGDLNLLLDVPVEQRATLRELTDVDARDFQIAEMPGRTSLVILLNLGDPRRPLPGIHPETGELLDQGQNPIFGDINVRQALQLAIDQNEIVEGVFQRSANPLSGLLSPASWAYDPTLAPFETNLIAANRLLDDAGWLDVNGDGSRECVRCQHAPQGTELRFSLGSPDLEDYYYTVEAITERWWQIGVVATETGGDTSTLVGQTFDAYLQPVGGRPYEDADPDPTLLLTPAGDTLTPDFTGRTLNFGSYHNLEVTRLVEEARTLPGCDLAARAEVYHEVERLVRDDLPVLYVAAPDEFYAAAPNVVGFAPQTGNPLWNIESWVVSP